MKKEQWMVSTIDSTDLWCHETAESMVHSLACVQGNNTHCCKKALLMNFLYQIRNIFTFIHSLVYYISWDERNNMTWKHVLWTDTLLVLDVPVSCLPHQKAGHHSVTGKCSIFGKLLIDLQAWQCKDASKRDVQHRWQSLKSNYIVMAKIQQKKVVIMDQDIHMH